MSNPKKQKPSRCIIQFEQFWEIIKPRHLGNEGNQESEVRSQESGVEEILNNVLGVSFASLCLCGSNFVLDSVDPLISE
jgi:hypothetical protein